MDETKVDGVTRINDHEFEFHNAHCFKIDIPQIGPFAGHFYKEIHKLGGTVYLNPDGECEIIWATREKPDFMRVYAA